MEEDIRRYGLGAQYRASFKLEKLQKFGSHSVKVRIKRGLANVENLAKLLEEVSRRT